MRDQVWTLDGLSADIEKHYRDRRGKWNEQIAFADATFSLLAKARWAHIDKSPEIRAAEQSMTARRELIEGVALENRAAELRALCTDHPAVGWLYAWRSVCSSVVRELARIGLFALYGLVTDSMAARRRLVEALFDARLLLDDRSLGWLYFSDDTHGWWQLRQRAMSKLRRRAKQRPPQPPLTPFEERFMESGYEAMHAVAHGGLIQSIFSLMPSNGSAAVDDDHLRFNEWYPTAGHHAPAAAALVLQFVEILAPEHPFMDQAVWRAGYDALKPTMNRLGQVHMQAMQKFFR